MTFLNLFDLAMIDVGSDDRAIFITGTRGSGKTALLEQLSIRAGSKKRMLLDLGSVSKTRHISRENLQALLLEVCSKSKNGVLVTIDEVQKVPVEDVSSICNAFQMASRKGIKSKKILQLF